MGCTRPLMTTLESPPRLAAVAVQHTPPPPKRTSIPVKVVGAKHHVAGALVPVRVDQDGTSYFPVHNAVLQAASRTDRTGQRALAAFGELVAAKVLTSVRIPGLGPITGVAQNPRIHGIDLLAGTTSGRSVAIEVKMTACEDPRDALHGRGSAAGLRQGSVDYVVYQSSLALSRPQSAGDAEWREASARSLVEAVPAVFMVFHVPTSRMIVYTNDGGSFHEAHVVHLAPRG